MQVESSNQLQEGKEKKKQRQIGDEAEKKRGRGRPRSELSDHERKLKKLRFDRAIRQKKKGEYERLRRLEEEWNAFYKEVGVSNLEQIKSVLRRLQQLEKTVKAFFEEQRITEVYKAYCQKNGNTEESLEFVGTSMTNDPSSDLWRDVCKEDFMVGPSCRDADFLTSEGYFLDKVMEEPHGENIEGLNVISDQPIIRPQDLECQSYPSEDDNDHQIQWWLPIFDLEGFEIPTFFNSHQELSSQTVTCSVAKDVEALMEKLEVMKRTVRSSNFKRLEEELKKGDGGKVPSYLDDIARRVVYPNIIGEANKFSDHIIVHALSFFYEVIYQMDNMQLQDINEDVLLTWGSVIKDAEGIHMDVGFAKDHLKKIAHAYFLSLKEPANDREELKALKIKISKLENALDMLKKLFNKKSEDLKVKMFNICRCEAESFDGNPLSKGILW